MSTNLDTERRYQRMDQFRVPAGFRGRSAIYTQLWWIVQSTLFAMSPQALFGWRRWLLRLFGATIGKGVFIGHRLASPIPGSSRWVTIATLAMRLFSTPWATSRLET